MKCKQYYALRNNAMQSRIHHTARIHPTAIIEEGVSIGAGTSVWDNAHIRRNTAIGENGIVGEKTYIAYDVKIGHGVKINAFVYICTGVTIEDSVMVSAGAIFTNDIFPRAFDLDGSSIKTSDPTEETLKTIAHRGVSIGSGSTIGPGIELGEYCMVGMGSVVTRDVLPYQLVYGNPAKATGFVCICGERLTRATGQSATSDQELLCPRCQRQYVLSKDKGLTLL
jgi:acetyltransferase-like isoleucine patch superfamily enzyme